MTIGYITIGYNDEAQGLAFFDAVLGAIGYERGPVEGGWAFYGKSDAPGVWPVQTVRRPGGARR